jgi:TPR repeat protein
MAADWSTKAAEQGKADAQVLLGYLYCEGPGVPQDYVQAYVWLNLAATSGVEEYAQFRDDVAAKPSPSELKKAQTVSTDLARQIKEGAVTTSVDIQSKGPSIKQRLQDFIGRIDDWGE